MLTKDRGTSQDGKYPGKDLLSSREELRRVLGMIHRAHLSDWNQQEMIWFILPLAAGYEAIRSIAALCDEWNVEKHRYVTKDAADALYLVQRDSAFRCSEGYHLLLSEFCGNVSFLTFSAEGDVLEVMANDLYRYRASLHDCCTRCTGGKLITRLLHKNPGKNLSNTPI